MICPACNNNLTEINLDGILLDVCQDGCKGVWFDWFELKKFDEPHEKANLVLETGTPHPDVKIDHSKKRTCPRCQNIVMMKHFSSAKKEIEVDECGNCAGFWLDYGELHKIRNQFTSEAEKNKFTEEFAENLFKMNNAENVSNAINFINP